MRLGGPQKRPDSFGEKKNYVSSARKPNYNFLVFQANSVVIVHSREKETRNKRVKFESIFYSPHLYIYIYIDTYIHTYMQAYICETCKA